MNRHRSLRGHRVVAVLALFTGPLFTSAALAPDAADLTERPDSPNRSVTLEVDEDGLVEFGGDYLYDPEEGDGLRVLRERLAAVAEDEESDEEGELELHLHADAEVPFESLQLILDAWRPIDGRTDSVHVLPDGEETDSCLLPLEELEVDDEDVLPLFICRVADEGEEDEDPELSYRIGDQELDELESMTSVVEELVGADADLQLLVSRRGRVLLPEVLELIEEVRDAGVETLAIAPAESELLERFVGRWECTTDAEWEAVYEYLTPERRKRESIERFTEGKELHEYEDLELHGVIDLRAETAFVSLSVVWTPRHEILKVDGEFPDDLSQEIEMVETWTRIDGRWYWREAARPQEFFDEHPELEED